VVIREFVNIAIHFFPFPDYELELYYLSVTTPAVYQKIIKKFQRRHKEWIRIRQSFPTVCSMIAIITIITIIIIHKAEWQKRAAAAPPCEAAATRF
jgi:hypothetical protein